MVAPGIASHRITSSHRICKPRAGTGIITMGIGAHWRFGCVAPAHQIEGVSRLILAQVPSQVLPIDMAAHLIPSHRIASHHGHRSIHFHLATAVRASTAAQAHAHAQAQAQAICWGAWLQFGHGCTGSRSCAISNWNLSFMWPEARVVSAARGHCLARTSTSTRTRNWLYLSCLSFPFLCLLFCLSPVVGLFIFLCLHCQQSINLRIMRVLKCNGKLSYSPKKCNQILCTALC